MSHQNVEVAAGGPRDWSAATGFEHWDPDRWFRGGRIVRAQGHLSRRRAVKAAGVDL
jgi:hypothetical protein